MDNLNEYNKVADECHPPYFFIKYIFLIIFVVSSILFCLFTYRDYKDTKALEEQQKALKLQTIKISSIKLPEVEENSIVEEKIVYEPPAILEEYKSLYEQNNDFVGWLTIPDTIIDYPVVQRLEDENYYVHRDFGGNSNQNGTLILDSDSFIGNGTIINEYKDGTKPSTNLIIHGHTMKNGQMFGSLKKYQEESFGKEHNKITFNSLYEYREYELISAFYSQVYFQHEEVFKYYNFFEATTQEEFDNWYRNIKKMSLYDTGVEASFGDEFLTLNCCAYHVKDGRFVVVFKRIK